MKAGPKTKASKGERKYVKINITISPELYDRLAQTQKKTGFKLSHLISEILDDGLKDRFEAEEK